MISTKADCGSDPPPRPPTRRRSTSFFRSSSRRCCTCSSRPISRPRSASPRPIPARRCRTPITAGSATGRPSPSSRISSTSRILRSTRTSASISARCPRISSSSSSRSKSRRRWRLHRPRQARQILPGVTLRQLAAETTVANVRHDRLDVPVLQELSRNRIQRRQHAVGGVVQRWPEERRAAERLVQQLRRRRPSDARVHGLRVDRRADLP